MEKYLNYVMPHTFKVFKYSFLAVVLGFLLQQLSHAVSVVVEAKAYDQRQRSKFPMSQSTPQMYGAAARYSQIAINNECNSEVGNQTHIYTLNVPNDAVANYAVVKVLEKTQRYTRITVCCPGYVLERSLEGDVCSPVCDDCRNGHCVGPNECDCFDGFVRNDNGDCVFSCPLGCLNGRCYLDETCKCDPGYKLDETRRFCRPICSRGCGSNLLLNCTEPEVCSCINGYTLTESGCRATCSPDCGPGGECNVNGVCVCKHGFTLKEGVCHATCYQSCENGMCYSRHRCICNPGFIYMENTGNCVEKP